LLRPLHPGNVGAVARAMKNMGLSKLVVVGGCGKGGPLANAMAAHAKDTLAGARLVPELAAALSGCVKVFGTTARHLGYRRPARPPRSLARGILDCARKGEVAIVFGPEDRGLSTEELTYCHELIRIPSSRAYPSLNLSHAVMICCYELFLAAARDELARGPAAYAEPRPARAEEISRMLESLKEALLAIGYLNRQNPEHVMLAIRRMLGRRDLEEREVRILLGIARQIRWAASQSAKARGADLEAR